MSGCFPGWTIEEWPTEPLARWIDVVQKIDAVQVVVQGKYEALEVRVQALEQLVAELSMRLVDSPNEDGPGIAPLSLRSLPKELVELGDWDLLPDAE